MILAMATTTLREAHVVPDRDGWAVVESGRESVASHHSTQREAVGAARQMLSARDGGEVVVHGRDGHIVNSDRIERSR